MMRLWDCIGPPLSTFDDTEFFNHWLRWGRGPVREQFQDFIPGDTKEVNVFPEIPALRDGVSRTITKAWLTIKSPEAANDPTENAAWASAGGMQSITTTLVAGRGVILNASEGSPELRFDITAANSALLAAHKIYHCSIQVRMDDGSIYEVERFTFETQQQGTIATS